MVKKGGWRTVVNSLGIVRIKSNCCSYRNTRLPLFALMGACRHQGNSETNLDIPLVGKKALQKLFELISMCIAGFERLTGHVDCPLFRPVVVLLGKVQSGLSWLMLGGGWLLLPNGWGRRIGFMHSGIVGLPFLADFHIG